MVGVSVMDETIFQMHPILNYLGHSKVALVFRMLQHKDQQSVIIGVTKIK